jgi:hypothetical protein
MDVAHKTIRDLPHFRVSAVAPNEANKDYFALFGEFDRTTDVVEGRCSLLMPHGDALNALSGYVQFHRPGEKTASVYVPTENSPEVLGLDLTYVHPRWNARHVWMISEPGWKWSRSKFCEADAVAKIVEGSQVSVVDGEEIKQWIQVSKKGNDSGLSRYYPICPSGKSTLQIEADGIIKGVALRHLSRTHRGRHLWIP